MGQIQVSNGKAFEYACLDSLYISLSSDQDVSIVSTPQLETAHQAFLAASEEMRDKLIRAANAATRVVKRLEPQLEYPDNNIPLHLSIQADAQGQTGDVRDVLCIRKQNEWEVGLSCKHNHRAVKHSRLSATIDFGAEWFNIPCSQEYFDTVTPLFEELRSMRNNSGGTKKWSDIDSKNEMFYIPVLRAFMDELKRLDDAKPLTIPERLIRYLVGGNDSYHIFLNYSRGFTRVEAFNMIGSLSRPPNRKQSSRVTRLRMPMKVVHMGLESEKSIIIVFDGGWAISVRILNINPQAEPLLGLIIDFASFVQTRHVQIEPWRLDLSTKNLA